MTPNNASSQRKPAAGPRRWRDADFALIRPILRPRPPIAPTSAGLGVHDCTLRHACRDRSANQAAARRHRPCPSRPSATLKSP